MKTLLDDSAIAISEYSLVVKKQDSSEGCQILNDSATRNHLSLLSSKRERYTCCHALPQGTKLAPGFDDTYFETFPINNAFCAPTQKDLSVNLPDFSVVSQKCVLPVQ